MSVFRLHSGGIELAVEVVGTGPAILYGHGLLSNRHSALAQLAPLAGSHRIVAFDQRGQGDSSPIVDPALYRAESLAEDMAAVLEALGISSAIIGGESLGAATATLFALAHPERVERILLVGPAFGDRPNPERDRVKAMGDALTRLGLDEYLRRAAILQRDEFGWPGSAIDRMRTAVRSHHPESLATALRAASDWVPLPDLSVLSRIGCAAHIIAWEGDPLHPLELAQRLASSFPSGQLVRAPAFPAILVTPEIVGRLFMSALRDP